MFAQNIRVIDQVYNLVTGQVIAEKETSVMKEFKNIDK